MCTHKKYITNRYTGDRLLVNCGRCKSCLQEKANRSRNRIRAALPDGFQFLFVCLSYKDEFIPYVLKSDLNNESLDEIPLYRDFRIRSFKGRNIIRRNNGDQSILTNISVEDSDSNRQSISFTPNMWKKGRGYHTERMALIYYKDVQDFFKRLRQNLYRRFGDNAPSLRMFTTSEYGETHSRPHFHTLIGTEQENIEFVRQAIFDSWLFADRTDLERNTTIARDAAAYVASYVNCGARISEGLGRLSKPKHSCSKNFGVELPSFRLDKILANADRGTMCYSRATKINGCPAVLDVPIPKYVINRFFPKFKGLCRLAPDSLELFLRFPEKYFLQHKHEGITNYDDKDHNDTWANYVRVRNSFNKYHSLTGRNIYDYAIDYKRVWNCYKNTLYRMQFDDLETPMLEKYDNINDLMNFSVHNGSLLALAWQEDNLVTDPNKFKRTKQLSDYYSQLYDKKCKTSKINNFIFTNSLNRNL